MHPHATKETHTANPHLKRIKTTTLLYTAEIDSPLYMLNGQIVHMYRWINNSRSHFAYYKSRTFEESSCLLLRSTDLSDI